MIRPMVIGDEKASRESACLIEFRFEKHWDRHMRREHVTGAQLFFSALFLYQPMGSQWL